MLDAAYSVVVLLTPKYHNMALVVGLAGGDAHDVDVSTGGAILVRPGVSVTDVHCIETGEDLVLDRDYALFHTGEPDDFVVRFVPVLRTAIRELGWPVVRDSLKDHLASRDGPPR